MKGQYLPFGDDTHITRDPIYDSLMETHEFDAATELYLRVIDPALAVLCTRLFKDHLQGSIHGSLDVNDPTLRQKYKSVPKSSKYAESIFGLLDHLIKQKPNITTLAAESYIMFSQNKTIQRINMKTQEKQTELLRNARKSTQHI